MTTESREFLPALLQRGTYNNASIATSTTVNGRPVRVVVSGKCHVCRAPDDVTRQVTMLGTTGVSAKMIWDIVHEGGVPPMFSYQSLRGHLKNHVGGRESVEFAQQAMHRIFSEIGEMRKVDPKHAVQLVIEKGFALMAGDRIEIKASDLLAASKLMAEFEANDADGGDTAFYGEAMSIMLTEMRKIMQPEQFTRLLWSLDSNERMRQIATLINGQEMEQNLIDAESRVVEPEDEFRAYPPVEAIETVAEEAAREAHLPSAAELLLHL